MTSNSLFPAMLLLVLCSSCSQTSSNAQQQSSGKSQKVGGECEGCEAIYESSVPFKLLKNVDTLPDFNEAGPKLKVSGTVYKADGRTPASNVVVYIYHTDQAGNYSRKGDEKGWGKRHGYIRGWVRTNRDGQYTFYTLRPAPYPGRNNPAHIHCVIKEENLNEYYIDEFLFADDPLITDKERSQVHPGGNGIMRLQKQQEMLVGHRDIFLGRNIKNYPVSNGASYISLMSGLAIGADCPAFEPVHVSGPDKGKSACPMCKYGRGQGIMVWWNNEKLDAITPFLLKMENAITNMGFEKLRVFVIYMNPSGKSIDQLKYMLDKFSDPNNFTRVALTYIPSPSDPRTAGIYEINPEASNTVFVYKKRKVIDKFVNYNFTGSTNIVADKLALQE